MPSPANVDSGSIYRVTDLSASGLNESLVPAIDVSQYSWVNLQIGDSAYDGGLAFFGSCDPAVLDDPTSTAWIPVFMCHMDTLDATASVDVTGGTSIIFGRGITFSFFQVIMTPYASGTATATLELRKDGMPGFQFISAIVKPSDSPNDIPWLANPNTQYPSGATPITNSSGNAADASAVATLANVTDMRTYITGFEVTGSGATSGLPVTVTVGGTMSGTLYYTYTAAVGALVANTPLIVPFDPAIPAIAIDTDIVVTCPALGSGNTHNTVTAHGYVL